MPATTPINRLAAAAERNKHAYTSLPSSNSIRIINFTTTAAGHLSISLTIINDFRYAPAYHALSYCWGDATETVDVLCNGASFSVTRNLYSALQELRSRDSDRMLWIDAICINQADIAERNQQVSIMKQIYANAKQVDVWVGVSDGETAQVVELIDVIAERCCWANFGPGSHEEWVRKLQQVEDLIDVVHGATLPDLQVDEASWKSLADFYERDWFARVWIIQEVQASQNVKLLCGRFTLEWEFVALVADWATANSDPDVRRHFQFSAGLLRTFVIREKVIARHGVPFLTVLHRAREFLSTDARDKVFAMLQQTIISNIEAGASAEVSQSRQFQGMTDEKQGDRTHLRMQVDYNKTTAAVYREVTLHSISMYKSLEVLCFVRRTTSDAASYPSWIPRWDIPENSRMYIMPRWLYNASAARNPVVTHVSEDSLIVRGIWVGTIAATSKYVDTTMGLDSTASNRGDSHSTHSADPLMNVSRMMVRDTWRPRHRPSMLKWERASMNPEAHFADFASFVADAVGDQMGNFFIPLIGHYCNVCNAHCVVAGTAYPRVPRVLQCTICHDGEFDVCADCEEAGKSCFVPEHMLQARQPVGFTFASDAKSSVRIKGAAAAGDAGSFAHIARHCVATEMFFSLGDGRMGSGPKEMQLGDVAAVLLGSTVPFVMRRSGDGYRVIGTCYVHGMMDGEAVQMSSDGSLKEEDFKLV